VANPNPFLKRGLRDGKRSTTGQQLETDRMVHDSKGRYLSVAESSSIILQ
jgi:hypothetical protein